MGHHGAVPIRVTTWNLQGRARPDLGAVAEVLTELEPDVVLLQEVQRRQVERLSAALGWSSAWRWKHWPMVYPAEGLALLSPHALAEPHVVRLAGGWFWSSRRRIAVVADVPPLDLRVLCTHLGSGVGDDERRRQALRTVDVMGTGPAVIGGDLNTRPASVVIGAYERAGFRDGWAIVHGDVGGATNWAPGSRAEPPTQRLDYVLTGPGVEVVGAALPTPDEAVSRFGRLSDHVPLTVEIRDVVNRSPDVTEP